MNLRYKIIDKKCRSQKLEISGLNFKYQQKRATICRPYLIQAQSNKLETHIPWCTWERNYVTHIAHASDVGHRAFEA